MNFTLILNKLEAVIFPLSSFVPTKQSLAISSALSISAKSNPAESCEAI